MGFMKTTGHRFGIAGELFSFFWSNKRWWMTPILITLGIFALLADPGAELRHCAVHLLVLLRRKRTMSRVHFDQAAIGGSFWPSSLALA